MTLSRRSPFGFPPATGSPSESTVRMVPLTQGVKSGDQPWTIQPPGSAVSMTNFVPLYGSLQPRSRLSSINTIASVGSVLGMTPYFLASGFFTDYWVSGTTMHGLMGSSGSISVASFTSAGGLGSVPQLASSHWQYATIFNGDINDNMVIAASFGAQSNTSLIALYSTGGVLRSSFLTGSPKAVSVAVYDNYVLAWGAEKFSTRMRWCVRGNPSNWTGEGSGFEDLLAMRGFAMKVVPTEDSRFIVFSDKEIWYGVSAAYPAQFQFYPLDGTHGCSAPQTIQTTDLGILYLGSDNKIRLLPKGGGPSHVLAPSISKYLQPLASFGVGFTLTTSFAVWDAAQRMYYLFYDPGFLNTKRCFVVNVETGEWGSCAYNTTVPSVGIATLPVTSGPMSGTMLYGNSKGTLFTTDYSSNTENGAAVTAVWQSGPIGADLPGDRKFISDAWIDYRSQSNTTLSISLTNNGQTFITDRTVALPGPTDVGRAKVEFHHDGQYPMLRLTTSSASLEINRIDVSLSMGGRG